MRGPDSNAFRQKCKKLGICAECYAPQSATQQRKAELVSALYCSKCYVYQPNWKPTKERPNWKHVPCDECGASLEWSQRCPKHKREARKAIREMREDRAGDTWDLLPEGWLPKERNKMRKTDPKAALEKLAKYWCASDAPTPKTEKERLARHLALAYRRYGWPDVQGHITHKDLADVFGAIDTQRNRAEKHLLANKTPEAPVVQFLTSLCNLSDREWPTKGRKLKVSGKTRVRQSAKKKPQGDK